MTDKTLKDRFHISADELAHRMELQEQSKEPVRKAVAILEAALDKVMVSLGVDITRDDIHHQQQMLGITITEETREELAGINGYYVFVTRKGDLIPHSWVGAARLNSDGRCYCDIHFFQDERLEEVGGTKLVGI
jgi:hypothetical protein